jgi:hypothetical protein
MLAAGFSGTARRLFGSDPARESVSDGRLAAFETCPFTEAFTALFSWFWARFAVFCWAAVGACGLP